MGRQQRSRQRLLSVAFFASMVAALGTMAFRCLGGLVADGAWGPLSGMGVRAEAGFMALGVGIPALRWRKGRTETVGGGQKSSGFRSYFKRCWARKLPPGTR